MIAWRRGRDSMAVTEGGFEGSIDGEVSFSRISVRRRVW